MTTKMPQTIEEKFTRLDRDMIIRLDEKVDNLIKSVDEVKDNTVNRVGQLEINKANVKDFLDLHKQVEDEERRMENMEAWRSWIIGVGAALGVIVTLITYIYFSDINQIKNSLEKHIENTSPK